MPLHKKAVSEKLFRLINELMKAEPLQGFYLVGGTALALYYGHRESVDIDLFTHTPFDAERLRAYMENAHSLQQTTNKENTVLGQINGIKTDFIAHRYPLIGEVNTIDGIRLLSVKDIAAMKLNAIANRGSKKDFWDYAELLKHFDREELLGFFTRKYPSSNRWSVEKSLCYFDDAENEPDPIDLAGQTWDQVKATILADNRLG
ncbi:hypothetical protein DDZ13_00360 [Coraliomargarita sinensis]|uniref:Nucleotidyl transferase AbiEii/AbiGii toxin family protein n=1 Tax=Coraliomargarita sinensis TaxID=2174842 RepID=A0A317ZK14_9BACT|nr:nucleotidyl transferase AbiEii/AbiGii toxin family protein [Coraliomargarita sinensis]PXA05352.1 hypothetical protein DDZ13_00360 [Coraliomargarita sinensis]